MSNYSKILISFLFVALSIFAGNNPDSVQNQVIKWESPWRSFQNTFEFNPAATYTIPVRFFKQIGASYSDFNADNGLHLIQEGNGASALKLFSESFETDSKFHFFGKANFISDQKRNVGWRDVEDYQLLSPYLIADSIGGTYKRESYALSGGSSYRYKHMEFGIRAAYQGGVSYRQVDPRPRNTVSSLSINPGITYQNENLKLGWFGEYKRYRQNVDIQVEKEGRKIYFYLLQGFGLYNHNFSGLDDSFSRIYKGNLYTTGINFDYGNKVSSTGFMLWINRNNIEAIETSNRIPYKITHNIFNVQLTKENEVFNRTLFLKGLYSLHQTIGNETQYKPVTINATFLEWQFATQSDRYQLLRNNIEFSALLAKKELTRFTVWEQLDVNWNKSEQKYYYPYYNQNVNDLTGSATIGFIYPLNKSSLAGSLKAGYKMVLSSSLNQNENTILTNQLILPDYYYLTKDIAYYQMNINYRFTLYKQLLINLTFDTALSSANGQNALMNKVGFALNF